ncbi:hypothetical protein [Candidatus Poriferisodalis sp.]|uniref:hypothetical protein n=1 Tax=Candidatus Poriferisodalis sp. TaxID=3101277 RepID=UPI003B020AAE
MSEYPKQPNQLAAVLAVQAIPVVTAPTQNINSLSDPAEWTKRGKGWAAAFDVVFDAIHGKLSEASSDDAPETKLGGDTQPSRHRIE